MIYQRKWSRWMAWVTLVVMMVSSLYLPGFAADGERPNPSQTQSEPSATVTEEVYGGEETLPAAPALEAPQVPKEIKISSPTNDMNILNARNNRNGAALELTAAITDTKGNPIEAAEGVKWYYKTSDSTMTIEAKEPVVIAESTGTQLTCEISDVTVNWTHQAGFIRIYAEYTAEGQTVVSSGITRPISVFKSISADKATVAQGGTLNIRAVIPSQYEGKEIKLTLKTGVNTRVKEDGKDVVLSGILEARGEEALAELSYTVPVNLAPGEYHFDSSASAPTPEVSFTVTEGTAAPQVPKEIKISSPTNDTNILNARNNRNGAALELTAAITDTEGNPIEAAEGVKWYYKTSDSAMTIEAKEPVVIAESAGTQLTYSPSDIETDWDHQAGYIKIFAAYTAQGQSVVSEGVIVPVSLFKSITADKTTVSPEQSMVITALAPSPYAGQTVRLTLKRGGSPVQIAGQKVVISGTLTETAGQAAAELKYTVPADLTPGEYSFDSHGSEAAPEVLFKVTGAGQNPDRIAITSPAPHEDFSAAYLYKSEITVTAAVYDHEGNAVDSGIRWYYKKGDPETGEIVELGKGGSTFSFTPLEFEPLGLDGLYTIHLFAAYDEKAEETEAGTPEEAMEGEGKETLVSEPVKLYVSAISRAEFNPKIMDTDRTEFTFYLFAASEVSKINNSASGYPYVYDLSLLDENNNLIAESKRKTPGSLDGGLAITSTNHVENRAYGDHRFDDLSLSPGVYTLKVEGPNFQREYTYEVIETEYRIKLITEELKSEYTPGEPITVRAEVTDRSGNPVKEGIKWSYKFLWDNPSYELPDDGDEITFTPENRVYYPRQGAYCVALTAEISGLSTYSDRVTMDIRYPTAWVKTYGGKHYDSVHSVKAVADGYVLLGSTASVDYGNNDVYLIKTDKAGNRLWEKTFGSIYADYASGKEALQVLPDGGFILTGYKTNKQEGQSSGFVYLIRTDAQGNLLWSRELGDYDYSRAGRTIFPTADGGYLVGGEKWIDRKYYSSIVIKTDAQGNQEWEKELYSVQGSSLRVFNGMVPAGGEDAYFLLTTRPTGDQSYRLWLSKLTSQGKILWEKELEKSESLRWIEGESLNSAHEGGLILTADAGPVQPVYGNFSYYAKIDAQGSLQWERMYSGSLQRAVALSSGGYALVGENSNKKGCLLITDPSGNPEKEWAFGIHSFSEGESASVTQVIEAGGDYVVFGNGYNGSNEQDIFIAKTGYVYGDPMAILSTPASHEDYNQGIPYGSAIEAKATVIDGGGNSVKSGIQWFYRIGSPKGDRVSLQGDEDAIRFTPDELGRLDASGIYEIYLFAQYGSTVSEPVKLYISSIKNVLLTPDTIHTDTREIRLQIETSPHVEAGEAVKAALLDAQGAEKASITGAIQNHGAEVILTLPQEIAPGEYQIKVSIGASTYSIKKVITGASGEAGIEIISPQSSGSVWDAYPYRQDIAAAARVRDSKGNEVNSGITWYYKKGSEEGSRVNLGVVGSSFSFNPTDLPVLENGVHKIYLYAEYQDPFTFVTMVSEPKVLFISPIKAEANLIRTGSEFSNQVYVETIFNKNMESQLQGQPITLFLKEKGSVSPVFLKGTAVSVTYENPEITAHTGVNSISGSSAIKKALMMPKGLPAGEYELTVRLGTGEESSYAVLPYTVFAITGELLDDSIAKTVAYLNKKVKNEGYVLDDWDAIALRWAGEDLNSAKWQDSQGRDYAYWKAAKLLRGDWGYSSGDNPPATDIERSILGIVASGHDPRNFAGINVVDKLMKKLEEGNYDFKGGDNAHIWGIIALYTADAGASDGYDPAVEEKFVKNFAQRMLDKGGELDFGGFGVDMAGMGMNAMGHYRNRIPVANEAYLLLRKDVKSKLTPDGSYRTSGYNPESTVTVVQGLVSAGEDPLASDFTNTKGNLLTNILQAQDERDGSFSHGSLMKNYMATQQSLMALTDMKQKESMYKGIPKKDLPPYEVKIPSILSVVLDPLSVQKGQAAKLGVTVHTLLIGEGTPFEAQLVTIKNLVDEVGQEIIPVPGVAAVRGTVKSSKGEVTLDIPDTLEIGEYYVRIALEGGYVATALFKVREWNPGPGPGPNPGPNPRPGTVSAYIRVEGYNRTLVPRQMVTTTNFDLTPYLRKATGSSATPSDGWDPDKLPKPTALHQLITALEQNRVSQYEVQDYGWSLYVAMIAGEREFDHRSTSGWMYRVNDWMPNYGSQAHVLKEGEDIVWYFGAYGSDTWYTKLRGDKSSAATGDKLVFTLKGMTTDMNTGASKEESIKDATIYVNGKPYEMEGREVKTDQEGKATLIFYEPGTYSISAERFSKDGIRNIIRPEPVTVNISGNSIKAPGTAAEINNPVYKELYDAVRGAATDKEIVEAVQKTLKTYRQSIEKISSQKDIENILKDIKDVLNIYSTAAERAQSSESAGELVKQSVQLMDAFTETLEKLGKTAEKQELAQDGSKVLQIIIYLMSKLQSEGPLDQAAEESIEAAAALLKAIGREDGKAVEQGMVETAKAFIQKFSTYGLSEKALSLKEGRVSARISITGLEELAQKSLEKTAQMEQRFKKHGIELGLTKAIIITIPSKDIQGAELQVMQELLEKVFELGVEKVVLKTELVTFHVSKNSFGEKAGRERITLTAEKVQQKDLSVAQRTAVPAESIILELNAKIGTTAVEDFAEPIEITLPYAGKVEEGKEVKVFLLKEDGSLEPVGGTYDSTSKAITFSTGHFSKYLAMQTEPMDQAEAVIPAMKQRRFEDLAGYAWAEEAIEAMAEKGILSGRRAGVFDPGANITRAEFAALITKLAEGEQAQEAAGFEDIDPDAWYYQAVAKAYGKGIIKGRNAREFDPDGQITREEMTVMISKVLEGKKASNDLLNRFKDMGEIAPWAEDAVSLSLQEGIISGMGDGSFAPKAKANRAQAAVMLYRLYNLIQK